MATAAAARRSGAADVWQSVFRVGVGAFWLYFGSQKWPAPYGVGPTHGIGWMEALMRQAAQVNPVPGVHDLLVQVVVPNWMTFALAQAIAENAVAVLLILGLATRPAALVATLLALNLSLTVAFTFSDQGVRWLYYMPALASFEVFAFGAGALALDRTGLVPRWLRW